MGLSLRSHVRRISVQRAVRDGAVDGRRETPGLAASVRLGQRRLLLQADDIELLYEEYGIVSSVLGADVKDLLSPAVIWLSARILRTEDAPVD